MTLVSACPPAAPSPAEPAPPASAPTSSEPSLLPSPRGIDAEGLTALLLLQVRDRDDSARQAMRQVDAARERQRRDIQAVQRALARAERAARREKHRHRIARIFGDVAKVAGVVASVALTVSTCGAATPVAAIAIAGVALSVTGQVLGETHALQALGMSDRAATFWCAGVTVVGALATGAAGVMGATEAVAEGAQVARSVASVSGAVGGSAEVGKAAYAERAACWHQRAADADTDALAAQQGADREQRQLGAILAALDEAEQRATRVVDTMASAVDQRSRALAVAGGVTWNG